VNVVDRPHAQAGGAGYALTGRHELLLPLLAACPVERELLRRRLPEPGGHPFYANVIFVTNHSQVESIRPIFQCAISSY
jgi:hypothetical protein